MAGATYFLVVSTNPQPPVEASTAVTPAPVAVGPTGSPLPGEPQSGGDEKVPGGVKVVPCGAVALRGHRPFGKTQQGPGPAEGGGPGRLAEGGGRPPRVRMGSTWADTHSGVGDRFTTLVKNSEVSFSKDVLSPQGVHPV